MTTCRFCGVALDARDATTLTLRGKQLVTCCPKHATMVKAGVKSSALFMRGAIVSGAKHLVNKKAPGLWDSATRALSAYRDLTQP